METLNLLMAIPNPIALLALCPLIFSMLRDYEAGQTRLDVGRPQVVDMMGHQMGETKG